MESASRAYDVPHVVDVHWGLKIPLRDGIELDATLYTPRKKLAVSPAIFTLTPYTGQTYHEFGQYFAGHGYPFLTVDARGRGNSEGSFRPFINEGQDGHDVVEWLARQPYCNGQVSMWGGSYAGYNQWTTAAQLPPHLATIVPVASPYMGCDVPMRNNIIAPYMMQWLTFVSGRTSQDKIFRDQPFWAQRFRHWFESGSSFAELDGLIGNPSRVFQEWIAHPHPDFYWDSYNPSAEQYAQLNMPILTITGIYDADQPGALTHYRQHLDAASEANRARHYLVIGPWDHAGTRSPKQEVAGIRLGAESLLDLRNLHLQWYHWTTENGPKPGFLRNNVAYYVTGADRWRYVDTLDEATKTTEPLYLHSAGTASHISGSGTLQSQIGRGKEDAYVYDPKDISISRIEFESSTELCLRPTFPIDDLTDQTLMNAMDGRQLVYHSAPFDKEFEITGHFRLSVWISIDQPDTDFGVAVFEMDAQNRSVLLSSDSMRARYRKDLRTESLISTGEPLQYEFRRFTFVSRLIKNGSRLRLVLGPINSMYSQKNYNSGGAVSHESMRDARCVTVRVFHDDARPSALYVPIGQQLT